MDGVTQGLCQTARPGSDSLDHREVGLGLDRQRQADRLKVRLVVDDLVVHVLQLHPRPVKVVERRDHD